MLKTEELVGEHPEEMKRFRSMRKISHLHPSVILFSVVAAAWSFGCGSGGQSEDENASDAGSEKETPDAKDGGMDCEVQCESGCGEPLAEGAAISCAEPTDEQRCIAKNAECERQDTGKCGFTDTEESLECGSEAERCEVRCDRTCGEPLPDTDDAIGCAEPTDEQRCIAENAECERQDTGKCGFTDTKASLECASEAESCEVQCGSACGEPLPDGVDISCAEPTDEQRCIAKSAECERQDNGKCGFTDTKESLECT